VQRSYLAPSYAASTGREALALDLLAEILGSGTQSRLYKSLVIDQKIAAYAAAWYSGDQLDSGTFGVYGAPNPGVDVDKVEAAIDAVLSDLLKNGVTQQELDRVRNQAIAERVYTLDNQAALARMAGVALTTGLSARSIFDRDVEIAKVTLDDMKAAAAKIIDLKRSVTGVLLPEPQTPN
jgi:zinc protease